MITVRYHSEADKAARYVAETLPAIAAAIRDESERGAGLSLLAGMMQARIKAPDKIGRLIQLHSMVRGGRYVDEPGPKDDVQDIRQTLLSGGDCEDWAAVLAAGAEMLGFAWWIETSGQPWDNFLHVYLRVEGGDGRHYVLDPKGSALGADFNKHSENNPVRRRWVLTRQGMRESA